MSLLEYNTLMDLRQGKNNTPFQQFLIKMEYYFYNEHDFHLSHLFFNSCFIVQRR